MTRLHSLRQGEGDGPLVVLSHALGCDLHMWDAVAGLLAAEHTVLRYDHRNHGGSETVAEPFGIDALADDAAALIEREAGGQPVHFVGLSMGGMVAQSLAARRPDLLASVTIANSGAHYPDQAPWQAREQTLQTQGIAAMADGAIARWLTPAWSQSDAGKAAAQALRRTLLKNAPAAYLAACKAVAAIDFRASNGRIAVPTLVIAGTQDEATPPAMSRQIADAIPGARLVSIDAAHLSAVEAPAAFVQRLRDFWHAL